MGPLRIYRYVMEKVLPVTSSISRRNLLRSSAVGGLGIAIVGSIEAIAGPAAAQAAQTGVKAVGYGPLVADPAGLPRAADGFLLPDRRSRRGRRCSSPASRPRATPTAPASSRRRHGSTSWSTTTRSAAPSRYGVPAAAGPDVRPGCARRHHQHRGRQPRQPHPRVRQRGRHAQQLRRRHHPVGHLADLRGDRGARRRRAAPRTTATSSRSTPPSAGRQHRQSPIPLKFLGRYAHEAVAVDPHTAAIYLTEDAGGPQRAVLPLDPAEGLPGRQGRAAQARAQPGRRHRGHPRGDEVLRRDGKHVADLSLATEPGTTLQGAVGRRARPRRQDRLGAQAVHRRPGHPQPQARGPVVGRRRRLLRRQLRPRQRRQRQRARRPGVVLRPARPRRSPSRRSSA